MSSSKPTVVDIETLAAEAIDGDERALGEVVRALQDPIYGLCLRMLGHSEDARDAAQEILVRIVTRLASFRGDAKLTTWAYRVASNYLIDLKRSPREAITFEGVDALLGQPPNPISNDALRHASSQLLAEETFLGCTLGLLRCLDRDHRLAFILGAILELEGQEAATILEISPAAFRKRLSRARHRLEGFMRPRCGVMNPDAPCRCEHQVNANVERGLVDPENLRLVDREERGRAQAHIRGVAKVIDSVEVFRRHPRYAAPDGLVEGLREVLRRSFGSSSGVGPQ